MRPDDWEQTKEQYHKQHCDIGECFCLALEDGADAIIDALKRQGERVLDANALDWICACDHLERRVSSPGWLVFIPEERDGR